MFVTEQSPAFPNRELRGTLAYAGNCKGLFRIEPEPHPSKLLQIPTCSVHIESADNSPRVLHIGSMPRLPLTCRHCHPLHRASRALPDSIPPTQQDHPSSAFVASRGPIATMPLTSKAAIFSDFSASLSQHMAVDSISTEAESRSKSPIAAGEWKNTDQKKGKSNNVVQLVNGASVRRLQPRPCHM